MLPDRVSNPGPLTYESGALPIALRGPACVTLQTVLHNIIWEGKIENCRCLKRPCRIILVSYLKHILLFPNILPSGTSFWSTSLKSSAP